MSLNNQQITSGKAGTAAYSQGDVLLALGGNVLLMLSFTLASRPILGLSIGLGVSDPAAWAAGLNFEVLVNGQSKLIISDELCTMLEKTFFPMDLPANAKIELKATTQNATNINVAAFIRAENFDPLYMGAL